MSAKLKKKIITIILNQPKTVLKHVILTLVSLWCQTYISVIDLITNHQKNLCILNCIHKCQNTNTESYIHDNQIPILISLFFEF